VFAEVGAGAGPLVSISADTGTSGGTYVGFGSTSPNPQDLTAKGTLDWRIWGRTPTSGLAANDHKSGGSAISDLTEIPGDAGAIALRGVGTLDSVWPGPPAGLGGTIPFGFKWADGTNVGVQSSQVGAGIQHNAPDEGSLNYGFSFTVQVPAGASVVTVWGSAHHGTGTLTATLGGGGSDTNASVSGGQNHGGIYTLNVQNDATPRALTVSYVLTALALPINGSDGEGFTNTAANVVLYAVALSTGSAAPTPDFSFGAPTPGASFDGALVVQQGTTSHTDIPVTRSGGAATWR